MKKLFSILLFFVSVLSYTQTNGVYSTDDGIVYIGGGIFVGTTPKSSFNPADFSFYSDTIDRLYIGSNYVDTDSTWNPDLSGGEFDLYWRGYFVDGHPAALQRIYGGRKTTSDIFSLSLLTDGKLNIALKSFNIYKSELTSVSAVFPDGATDTVTIRWTYDSNGSRLSVDNINVPMTGSANIGTFAGLDGMTYPLFIGAWTNSGTAAFFATGIQYSTYWYSSVRSDSTEIINYMEAETGSLMTYAEKVQWMIDRDIDEELYAWSFLDYNHFTTVASLDTIRDFLYKDIYRTAHDSVYLTHTVDEVHLDSSLALCSGTPSDLDSCARVDLLKIDIDTTYSYVYVYNPTVPNDTCVFVSYGHTGEFGVTGSYFRITGVDSLINDLLVEGYTVVAMHMANLACNIVSGDINKHEFGGLESATFNPLFYMIAPQICALNYIEDSLGFSEIYATGISGGGWEVAYLGAMDDRIIKTIDVAGTYPQSIKICEGTVGDWEQEDGDEIYERIDYLDLYGLAAKNGLYQLRNITDPCCFTKYYWELYTIQMDGFMTNRLGLSSEFIGYSYTYPLHWYSEWARNKVIEIIRL